MTTPGTPLTDALDHPLTSAWAKLRRGREHIRTLDTNFGWSLRNASGPPITTSQYLDHHDSSWVVLIGNVAIAPIGWALLVGDAANNLRAALDHLVWELSFIDSNGKEPQQNILFPLIQRRGRSWKECSRDFERNAPRLLQGLTLSHRAVVKRFQPYHQWAKDEILGEYFHPFGLLADLTNDDKHRVVQPSFVAATEFRTRFPHYGGNCEVAGNVRGTSVVGRPFRPGAEILRIAIKTTGPDPLLEVEAEAGVYIGFRDGRPVLDTLEAIATEVDKVLNSFEPAFNTPKAKRIWQPREGRIRTRPRMGGTRVTVTRSPIAFT